MQVLFIRYTLPMNSSQWKWLLFPFLAAVFFSLLIQLPLYLAVRDTRFEGVPLHFNSDESVYMARVQEVLKGDPAEVAEGAVGDPQLRGGQPALLEWTVGTIFRFTGLQAAAVLGIMDSVTIFLLVLILFRFFRQAGFSAGSSLVAVILFCIIELYNLNRPIHQGLSVLLVMAGLSFFLDGIRGRLLPGVAGALLIGLSAGDYFWSWTWCAVWLALYVFTFFPKNPAKTEIIRAAVFLFVAVAAALPFLKQLYSLALDPLFADATLRSGMHPGRLPESLPYSVIFSAMAVTAIVTCIRDRSILERCRAAIVTIVTAWIVIHQQLVHGQVFNFVSHYLLLMIVAAFCSCLLAWHERRLLLWVGAVAAFVYLTAVTYDGRYVLKQINSTDRYSEQYLSTAISVLEELPKTTILTDPDTSMFLPTVTRHDVVWFLYLKNVLISHVEIARRYCLTQLPVAAEARRLEDQTLIWPDANSAFRDPELRQREVNIVKSECTVIDKNPKIALTAYGVTHILWNEKTHPDWNLQLLDVRLQKTASGSGWSLWKIVQ